MKPATVVMYPFKAISHIGPMVELAKLTHIHHPSLSFNIIITPAPFDTGSADNYIATVSSTAPFITFHRLPTVALPQDLCNSSFIDLAFGIPELYKEIIHDTLVAISVKSVIKGVIFDVLSSNAFPVAESLDLPTYYFGTSGASVLCQILYLTTVYKPPVLQQNKDLDSDNMYIDVPGVSPIHISDLGTHFLDQQTNSYKNYSKAGNNMIKSSGFIINTFVGYEQRAIDALAGDQCTPNGHTTPPAYLVGPLSVDSDQTDPNSCLKWLDSQPYKSVVFICFGSLCVFDQDQIREMANGLERSGQRFLWVVRHPNWHSGVDELDVEMFPTGWLARVREKGLVVKNWAPQVAILNHESVGGFVFHCGWNSVYEAVVAGVPMVAWPLYKEQKMNRGFVVEEIKVALAVEMSPDGFVTAEEVAEKVRELMEGEDGRRVRDRTVEMSRKAKAAVAEGGSREVEFLKLFHSWNV